MAFIPVERQSIKEGRKTRTVKNPPKFGKRPTRTPSVKFAQKGDFIVWDGEGMTYCKAHCVNSPKCEHARHEYTYLACFNGSEYEDLTNVTTGIGTEDALRMLYRVGKRTPGAIHVIFAGSYDANMIFRDIDKEALRKLQDTETCEWNGWTITYRPRKFLRVYRGRKGITLWDVWGFFQGSFVKAAESWVPAEDTETKAIIEQGKAARANFQPSEIETVAHYCQMELKVFYSMMVSFKQALDGLGLYLNRWDGAAAIAAYMLKEHDVRYHLHRSINKSFRTAVQCAYAGGRIELFQPGDHQHKIYHYDINSAYPSAMVHLPSLQWGGYEKCTKRNCSAIGDYDLCHVTFNGMEGTDDTWFNSHAVYPFFHRDEQGNISFPVKVRNWYWAPEVKAAQAYYPKEAVKVGVHYHYRWNSYTRVYPFDWVAQKYAERLEYKKQKSMLEKPLKLGMNSLYGKLAQQVGYDPKTGKRPKYHQLEWAGWITSYTRSRLFLAAMQAPDKIIAFETDGIYSLVPLDLPLSNALGDWDYQEHSRLTYVQSGVYFADSDEAELTSRYRGFDKGALSRDAIIKAWRKYSASLTKNQDSYPNTLPLPLTRFRTLATSLIGLRFDGWRQWSTETRELQLTPVGKRIHAFDCHSKWGANKSHTTIPIQPQDHNSKPHPVVWESQAQAKAHQQFWDDKTDQLDGIEAME